MDVECDTLLTEFNFERRDGSRYVGGFVGTTAARDQWLAPQIQQWVRGVETLAKVARRFPQTAYAGLTRSLQQEWQYLQRVTPAVADAFGPVEAALADSFLPALLGEDRAGIVKLRELLALPVPDLSDRPLSRGIHGRNCLSYGVPPGGRPVGCNWLHRRCGSQPSDEPQGEGRQRCC